MNPKFNSAVHLLFWVCHISDWCIPSYNFTWVELHNASRAELIIMLILLNEDGYKLGKFSVALSCLSCGIFCLCVIISSLPMIQGRSTIHVRSILTDLFVPHSVFVIFKEFVSYINCFQVWYQNLIVEIINPLWL